MELALAILAATVLLATGRLVRSEVRTMRVEWRVRRGLRVALAQEA